MASVYRENLLEGKVALITHGSSGVGLEIAKYLSKHGASIAILDQNLERLKNAKAELENGRKICEIFQCNMSDSEIDTAIDFVLQKFSKIDILVNNSAWDILTPLGELSKKEFKKVIKREMLAIYSMSQVVVEKYMMNHGGSIINISSTLQMPCLYLKPRAKIRKLIQIY